MEFDITKESPVPKKPSPGKKKSSVNNPDGKPKFLVKNSKKFLLLIGHPSETRVIVESFLQANA
jgi:hypothetical protein